MNSNTNRVDDGNKTNSAHQYAAYSGIGRANRQSHPPIIKHSTDRNEGGGDTYHHTQPHSYPRQYSDFPGDNQNQPLSQNQYSSEDNRPNTHLKAENKRMALYVIGILVVSMLIFSGVVYAAYTGFGKHVSDTRATANKASLQNGSSGKNDESSSVSGPDAQNAPANPVPKEELPMVDSGFTVGQVYTNRYFPDTSIAYAAGWNYTNETSLSQYANLIARTIVLSKDTSKLSIAFKPKIVTGCSGETKDLVKIKDIPGSNLSRYQSPDPSIYYYLPSTAGDSFNSDCVVLATQIVTTVDSASAPEYAAAFPGELKVISFVVITLQTTTPQAITQADAMITKSRFNIIPR